MAPRTSTTASAAEALSSEADDDTNTVATADYSRIRNGMVQQAQPDARDHQPGPMMPELDPACMETRSFSDICDRPLGPFSQRFFFFSHFFGCILPRFLARLSLASYSSS